MSTITEVTTTQRTIESSTPWPLYRMSLEQYETMVESGIFTEHDRLHLIDGILVARMTQGDDHCTADDLCRSALQGLLPAGWYIRSN